MKTRKVIATTAIAVAGLTGFAGSAHADTGTFDTEIVSMNLTGDHVSFGPVQAEVDIDDVATTDESDTAGTVCYLQYKLDRCFVKSWSTGG